MDFLVLKRVVVIFFEYHRFLGVKKVRLKINKLSWENCWNEKSRGYSIVLSLVSWYRERLG